MREIDIVCGIIQQQDTFLIAKRGKGVRENIWEFPGGKVEKKETLEMAILRELKEELSLNVSIIRYITSVEDKREDCCLHVHVFLCEITSGALQLHVHHEAKFVQASELHLYEFEKADAPILNEIVSWYR